MAGAGKRGPAAAAVATVVPGQLVREEPAMVAAVMALGEAVSVMVVGAVV